MILTKYGSAGDIQYRCAIRGSNDALTLMIGDGGANWDRLATTMVLPFINRWYHLSFIWNNSTKLALIRAWDDTAGSLIGTESVTLTYAMGSSTSPINFGRSNLASEAFDGNTDEDVFFNSVRSTDDVDAIRAGTFGEQPPTYKISGYLQDPSAKIIVLGESDWEVETTQDVTLGNYEIVDLVSGTKTVAAVSPEGEVVGFGGVDPVEV